MTWLHTFKSKQEVYETEKIAPSLRLEPISRRVLLRSIHTRGKLTENIQQSTYNAKIHELTGRVSNPGPSDWDISTDTTRHL